MLFTNKLKELLPKSKSKKELDEHYENIRIEKGDLPAMIIAALITFLPILIVAMLVFYGLLWILFIR